MFFLLKCWWVVLAMMTTVTGYPSTPCPQEWRKDPIMKDLVVLSDAVSWDGCSDVRGYPCIQDVHGKYDTRMKIYQTSAVTVFVFRPTQNTAPGQDIHKNRRLVSCVPLLGEGCLGMVNDRFQEAFCSLMGQVDLQEVLSPSKAVYLTGHSLGGALQLMMGVYLYFRFSVVPSKMIGFAGPFIGDTTFTDKYVGGLRSVMSQSGVVWQIETIDQRNPQQYDGTVEGYQVDGPPYMQIETSMICGIPIDPLPDSYGLHDLRNYALFFEAS
uniref:Fungal lipase-type domain-containing protein n=1 Tax=viral metagenome TaxID=1070528 RepID=A0A6C0K421_9ZZZZ